MSTLLHLTNVIGLFAPHRELLGIRRALYRLAGITSGKGTRITHRVAFHGSYLSLGCNVFIGAGSDFHSCEAGPIKVGDNVAFAPRCLIVSGSHFVGPPEMRAGEGRGDPIEIGDGCWIGAGSTILGGARIAPGSIVAAGSVVRAGDYPESVLLAGVPATVRKIVGMTNG